jgi:hypothetical protein
MGSGTVTLTVSAPGYQTATVSGVTVTNGSTTTQNVQLVPLSNIVGGTGTVAADSCNSNSVLDPNETVTVNLSIANTVLRALQPQTSREHCRRAVVSLVRPAHKTTVAVVAGQPAVSRPFTFIVNASCGGTVTASLQLQDGATNYGTRTFTFPVGTIAGAFPSTGAISVIVPDNSPSVWTFRSTFLTT